MGKVLSIDLEKRTCQLQYYEPWDVSKDRLYTGQLYATKRRGKGGKDELYIDNLSFESSFLYWNFKLKKSNNSLPAIAHSIIWTDNRMQAARQICSKVGIELDPPSLPGSRLPWGALRGANPVPSHELPAVAAAADILSDNTNEVKSNESLPEPVREMGATPEPTFQPVASYLRKEPNPGQQIRVQAANSNSHRALFV